MDKDKKEALIKELTNIHLQNNGSLPRGTVAGLARKYECSNISVKNTYDNHVLVEKNGRADSAPFLPMIPSIGESRPMNQEDFSLTAVKHTLYKLEGSIQGIMPFHPRLASYMMQQVNYLHRYFYDKDTPKDASKLSYQSKPDYEDIDREILSNDIADKKMMRGLNGNGR